jgi:hypothetical protein
MVGPVQAVRIADRKGERVKAVIAVASMGNRASATSC